MSLSHFLKRSFIYTYNRTLLDIKKEGNSDTLRHEPWGHDAKWKQPVTKRQIPDGSPHRKYLEESNSQREKTEWWLTGAGEGGGGSCLMGTVCYQATRILEVAAQQGECPQHFWTVCTLKKWLGWPLLCYMCFTTFKNDNFKFQNGSQNKTQLKKTKTKTTHLKYSNSKRLKIKGWERSLKQM